MRGTVAALLAASSLALLTPRPARAQEGSAAGEALFNEGRALAERGQFVEACDRFARSQQLAPAVGKLLNLGECNERLGKVASAWGAYSQARSLGLARNDPRAAIAGRAASALEPRLPHLDIAVDRTIAGLTVTRNGVKIESAALDLPIPVDPGSHDILVTAPGHKPWRATFVVREAESHALKVPALEPLPATEPTLAPDAGTESHAQLRVALGLEIGGGAALGAGLILGGLAFSRWGSVTDTCPDARCPDEAARARRADDASAARTFATISTIAVSAGAIALVTGIVLHVTAPGKRVAIVPTSDGRNGGLLVLLQL